MFTYILRSIIDGSQYVGMTENPDRGLQEHNAGMVYWTKRKKPWVKVLVEEWPDRVTARRREKYLKSAAGRRFRQTIGLSNGTRPIRTSDRSGGS
jgi:putative endonuclease